jgi:homogentisate 1,2-dioxygenase
MTVYMKLGSIPRKRHIVHKREGASHRGEGMYYEEVVTTAGFGRAYSICYHLRPPTRVVAIEHVGVVPLDIAPDDVLRHHHLKSGQLEPGGNPVMGRVPLLANDDIVMYRCRPVQAQDELYRNARADEIIFVHHGRGTLTTMFGVLPFRALDYIVIPRCTTYRLDFEPTPQPDLLVLESTGIVRIPENYLNPDGQLRLGAPYSERDLHGPRELAVVDRMEETSILIKDERRLTRYVMGQHPFDVVGWDGLVYPFTFNALDFEPITGTIHQPPPIQQTFDAPGFVVCTFAPRYLDHHPEAVKVPYAHSNVQADEVLYYAQGKFGSRRGVEEGSFTLHPHGIPHGPHPGTIMASMPMIRTDELAVMVDTVKPLQLTRQALELDDPQYPLSWIDG